MKLLDRSRVAIETLSTAKKADEDKAVVGQMLKSLEHLVAAVFPHVLPMPEEWKPRLVPGACDDAALVAGSAGGSSAGGGSGPLDDLEQVVKELGGETVSSLQSESAIRMCGLRCDEIQAKIETMQRAAPPPAHVEALVSQFGGEIHKICKTMAHRANLFFDYLFSRCTSMDLHQTIAAAQKDVNDLKLLFDGQWSVLVEPYARFVKAADAQSSRKPVIAFEGLHSWVHDCICAWDVFMEFVGALGVHTCPIPRDADALQGQWSDALKGIGQDSAARSALARLCGAHRQLCKVPESMACGQRQAYDKWLRPGVTAFVNMLQHLAVNITKAIVGGAIEDLKTSLVVAGAKELVDALNEQPPRIHSSVMELIQPDGAIAECLAIANAGNADATRVIAKAVSLSMAKHLMVKTVNALVSETTTVAMASMIPVARVTDSFVKDIWKLKQYELEQQEQDDAGLMCKLVKQKVILLWCNNFQDHLDKDIIKFIPKDFAAIVSTQVTASINQVMFTRAKVLLVQSIDQTCEQHEFFKKLDLVQLGAEDEQFVAQWKRIEQNVILATQYALTWDACDLMLNKLPSTKFTEKEKIGFIRECYH